MDLELWDRLKVNHDEMWIIEGGEQTLGELRLDIACPVLVDEPYRPEPARARWAGVSLRELLGVHGVISDLATYPSWP